MDHGINTTRSASVTAVIAAIVTHTFWGVSFLASRTALDTAHMFLLLSHRFLTSFLVLNLILLTGLGRLRLRGKRVLLAILLGVCEPVVYFFGEQYGILHSNTIFSGVMIAMIPIVSMAAAGPILHERSTAGQVIFSILSVCGVIGMGMMSRGSGALEWGGVAALVIAVVSAAAYTLLSRGISGEFSPFERTYILIGLGAAVFTVLAMLQCRGSVRAYLQPLATPSYLISILFLSVCCSVLGYFLSSYALTKLPVAQATVFSNLTTAVSVFAGAYFLHEPFNVFGLICSIVILVGIWGVQVTAPKEN